MREQCSERAARLSAHCLALVSGLVPCRIDILGQSVVGVSVARLGIGVGSSGGALSAPIGCEGFVPYIYLYIGLTSNGLSRDTSS